MKMKKLNLSSEQVNALLRYHLAVVRVRRFKDSFAPKVIIDSIKRGLKERRAETRRLKVYRLYPEYKNRLERFRLQSEAETKRKFDCLHHAETVSRLPDYPAPKRICPFGGHYGSHTVCTACTHFKALTDSDRIRLNWEP
jgi:hypothetical protein